ncbi:hypothetical protein H0H92_010899 [Tricholoma furcatifolium]|nr:hypothetical protein H0H92_010899 [Tricholoma furcatifolium]
MSVDPYHAVEQEVQVTLQSAAQLRSSYLRIRSTAREDSEELQWAISELKGTLAALEADLEDLDESVKIVESTDARNFGLDDAEVQRRRRYVGDVRKEIQNMRAELHPSSQPSRPPVSNVPSRKGVSSPSPEQETRGEEDHQEAWAREEQQLIMREQDRTMDSLAGTLHTLAQQAGLMGQEIVEHNESVVFSPSLSSVKYT